MTPYLLTPAGRLPLVVPHPGADHADAPGACPRCGATPWGVAGASLRPSADDRAWEADGYCTACKGAVGTIRHEPETFFGVREDAAVLGAGARWRVY